LAIIFTQKGDFSRTEKYLTKLKTKNYRPILERYANEGLSLLRSATPKETGETADSWTYKIVINRSKFSIQWLNDHKNNGLPIVILLQYGHGTTGGTFVEGRDFINPVMRPLFDKISTDIWKEVTSL
jgi:hypothetical protein